MAKALGVSSSPDINIRVLIALAYRAHFGDKAFDDLNISIELNSHTDSRGSSSANQTLSQARAQSVVNYLVAKGINKNRLVAKGFGETKLVNKCADGVTCTEAQHQQNRRTEFRIISK